jgi:hypothetical protein
MHSQRNVGTVEEQSGLVLETKDTVEAAIFREVHDKRYTLAKEAPICSRRLFDDFGYVANTPASRAVLDRTYQAPEDSDIATKELLDEVAAIRQLIPKDSAPTIITPEKWTRYWAIINKKPHPQNQGYTLAITLSGASQT